MINIFRKCFHLYFKARLTLALFIKVSAPSQESEPSYICVLLVSIVPLFTFFLLHSGTVPTMWYFLFFILVFILLYIIFILLFFFILDCNHVDNVLTLPTNINCYVKPSCTNIVCCEDVDMLRRSFETEINIDPCDFKLTVRIERLRFDVPLFDYKWGTSFLFSSQTQHIFYIHLSC